MRAERRHGGCCDGPWKVRVCEYSNAGATGKSTVRNGQNSPKRAGNDGHSPTMTTTPTSGPGRATAAVALFCVMMLPQSRSPPPRRTTTRAARRGTAPRTLRVATEANIDVRPTRTLDWDSAVRGRRSWCSTRRAPGHRRPSAFLGTGARSPGSTTSGRPEPFLEWFRFRRERRVRGVPRRPNSRSSSWRGRSRPTRSPRGVDVLVTNIPDGPLAGLTPVFDFVPPGDQPGVDARRADPEQSSSSAATQRPRQHHDAARATDGSRATPDLPSRTERARPTSCGATPASPGSTRPAPPRTPVAVNPLNGALGPLPRPRRCVGACGPRDAPEPRRGLRRRGHSCGDRRPSERYGYGPPSARPPGRRRAHVALYAAGKVNLLVPALRARSFEDRRCSRASACAPADVHALLRAARGHAGEAAARDGVASSPNSTRSATRPPTVAPRCARALSVDLAEDRCHPPRPRKDPRWLTRRPQEPRGARDRRPRTSHPAPCSTRWGGRSSGHPGDPRTHPHGPARARALPARGASQRRQDHAHQGRGGRHRQVVQADPVHPRPPAERHHRRHVRALAAATAPSPCAPGPSSPTWCSATRSTARPPRPRAPSSKPCRAPGHHRRRDHRLASPFFVLATQNPIEQGHHPPEAQVDRFPHAHRRAPTPRPTTVRILRTTAAKPPRAARGGVARRRCSGSSRWPTRSVDDEGVRLRRRPGAVHPRAPRRPRRASPPRRSASCSPPAPPRSSPVAFVLPTTSSASRPRDGPPAHPSPPRPSPGAHPRGPARRVLSRVPYRRADSRPTSRPRRRLHLPRGEPLKGPARCPAPADRPPRLHRRRGPLGRRPPRRRRAPSPSPAAPRPHRRRARVGRRRPAAARMRRERLEGSPGGCRSAPGTAAPATVTLPRRGAPATDGGAHLGTAPRPPPPTCRHARWKGARRRPAARVATFDLEVRPARQPPRAPRRVDDASQAPRHRVGRPLFPNPIVESAAPRVRRRLSRRAARRARPAPRRPPNAERAADRRSANCASTSPVTRCDASRGPPARGAANSSSRRTEGRVAVHPRAGGRRLRRPCAATTRAPPRSTTRSSSWRRPRVSPSPCGDRLGMVAFDRRVVCSMAPATAPAPCASSFQTAVDLRALVDARPHGRRRRRASSFWPATSASGRASTPSRDATPSDGRCGSSAWRSGDRARPLARAPSSGATRCSSLRAFCRSRAIPAAQARRRGGQGARPRVALDAAVAGAPGRTVLVVTTSTPSATSAREARARPDAPRSTTGRPSSPHESRLAPRPM